MDTITQVNEWAKKSCAKWNKIRFLRKINRERYREAARRYWEGPGRRLSELYKSGEVVNTYPWPYSDPEFAKWEEDDSPENYSLVSDQSSCVVRYATSYCAWKIFEATGTWPQKISSERLDARRWVQFLNEAGYHVVVSAPSDGHRYVGVNPNVGEWGIVVWFEKELDNGEVLASSYIRKNYRVGTVRPGDYLWILIK